MLNLAQVQTFLTVVNEGGIQAAAERLSCSQPAVSQQLKKLEEFLGVPLVLRSRVRAVPTQDGKVFLPQARSLVATAERATALIAGRRFAVRASGNIGVFLAPHLIAGFERELGREGVVELDIGTNRRALDALLAGEVDVIMTEWTEDHPLLEWHSWRREKMVLIVSPNHPLAALRRIRKDELLAYPMIGGEPGTGTGRALRSLFGDDVERLRISRQLGSTAAVKEAVKANLGLSIVLAYTVAEEVSSGALVTVDIEEADLFKTLFLGLSRESPQSSIARRFCAFCAEQNELR